MDTERMPERGILFHFRSQNTNIEPSLSVVINTFGRVISPITPQRDQRAEGKYSADQRVIICQNAIEYYEYGCGYA